MRSIGRPAGALAAAVVMATALLGSVQTLWFEDIQISSVASTAELDAKITCAPGADNDGTGPLLNPSPPFWLNDLYPPPDPLKNVGTFGIGDVTPHEINLTVTNAYPGYAADCQFHLTNNGTVPWHLEVQEILVLVNDEVVLTGKCTVAFAPCHAGDVSPTDPDGDPLYVQIDGYPGCQVHKDGRVSGSLLIGVNQSALEDTTYQVVVRFRVHQWNESIWKGCGALKLT